MSVADPVNVESESVVGIRLPDFIIPEEDPFQNDRLHREAIVNPLSTIVLSTAGPYVISISAPWGTGKTIFLKMWKRHLENLGSKTIYLNAWETDFAIDPLAPLISRLSELGKELGISKNLDNAKKLASSIAKRAIPVVIRAATLNILDVDREYEKIVSDALGNATEDVVAKFAQDEASLQALRSDLTRYAQEITGVGAGSKLVVFLDDLDRCRPTYAIEVLERIKHVFSIESVIFVIALDRDQLAVSLGRVYGAQTNTNEYIRRFIDVDYRLPIITTPEFIQSLFYRSGLSEDFATRAVTMKQDPISSTAWIFSTVAEGLNLKLRAQENAFARLTLVCRSSRDEPLFGHLLAFLVLLRESHPDRFLDYVEGRLAPTDLVNSISDGYDLRNVFRSDESILLEALIYLGSPNDSIRRTAIDSLESIISRETGGPSHKPRPPGIIRKGHVRDQIVALTPRCNEIFQLYRRIDFVSSFET